MPPKKTARQIGKASRAKGNRGELEVAKVIDHWLDQYEVKRTPNSGGLWIPGDLNGVPFLHIESKRQETLHLVAWILQASQDCPDDQIPIVVFRKNLMRWRVDLDLEDFLSILAVLIELIEEDQRYPDLITAVKMMQLEKEGGTLCK